MTKKQKKDNPFSSSHHLITLAAYRYALGRESYIVGDIVDWIIEHWHEMDQKTLHIILDETEQALHLGSCGSDCDVQEWERLLKFAEKKCKFV